MAKPLEGRGNLDQTPGLEGAQTSLSLHQPTEVVAAEKQGVRYQVIVQIGIPKYRGSFNTLVFGESDLAMSAPIPGAINF